MFHEALAFETIGETTADIDFIFGCLPNCLTDVRNGLPPRDVLSTKQTTALIRICNAYGLHRHPICVKYNHLASIDLAEPLVLCCRVQGKNRNETIGERLERIILPFKMHDRAMERLPPPLVSVAAGGRRSVRGLHCPGSSGSTKKRRMEESRVEESSTLRCFDSPLASIGNLSNFSIGVGNTDRSGRRSSAGNGRGQFRYKNDRDSLRGRGMSPLFSPKQSEARNENISLNRPNP